MDSTEKHLFLIWQNKKSELNDKPDTFERKFDNLLSKLLKDLNGIRKLSDMTETTIQAVSHYHHGNGMIGGTSLSDIHIKKLPDLNLSIDFGFYSSGNPYIS